jgi:hypothetical protein
MRLVESSFLQRSLTLSWIAAVALALGGCVWHDGGHHHGWGWDDDDHHHGDRDRDHDHDWRYRDSNRWR